MSQVSAEQGLAKTLPEALRHLLRYLSEVLLSRDWAWSPSLVRILQYQVTEVENMNGIKAN